MGSGSSKCGSSSASSSSSGVRWTRSRASRVFQYSCLGFHDADADADSDPQSNECSSNAPSTNQTESKSDHVKVKCYRKVKVEQSDEMPCTTSDIELDEWRQTSIGDVMPEADSSYRTSPNRSLNPSKGLFCRFGFFPGNISFRLSRAASLGSSRAHSGSSTNFSVSNNEDEVHLHTNAVSGLVNRNETQQDSETFPTCIRNRCPISHYEVTSGNMRVNPLAASSSINFQDDEVLSALDMVRDSGNTRMGLDLNFHSPRSQTEIENIVPRLADRRIVAREPVDRNFRFSRTLSVGRLRDRVLRRSSFSELPCPLLQEREVRHAREGGEGLAYGSDTIGSASEENALMVRTSSTSNSLYRSQDYEVETSRSREARYHDLLEHRSSFLERRRRIRSQVRALQRLGSRFENLSSHERSCILTGQHRTGRCSCRLSTRDANPNDDTGARASISRIVMLAEALFEVLDEIHQQSVVLSSNSSVSSIGSIPAPTEVVESLPIKLYTKMEKHPNEDAGQCYICLVEYEDGDSMRILPCHHEFHRTCIDKWLKEIHRVCPLCRGDICRSISLLTES